MDKDIFGTISCPPIPRSSTFRTDLGIWGFFFFLETVEALGILFPALIALWWRGMHCCHVSFSGWWAGLVSNEGLFNFPAFFKANLFYPLPFFSHFFTFPLCLVSLILSLSLQLLSAFSSISLRVWFLWDHSCRCAFCSQFSSLFPGKPPFSFLVLLYFVLLLSFLSCIFFLNGGSLWN